MNFTIPHHYNVGGQEIEVQMLERIDNSDSLGDCSVAEGRIRIAHTFNGNEQSYSSKQNTFFHELIHSILVTMGECELNQNEKFVCTMAGFLTEAIKTME